MAFRVLTGTRSRVTTFSARVLSLQYTLIRNGARIVRASIGPDGTDLGLPPIRAEIVLAALAIPTAANDEEEEIPVLLDEPAIAALEAWRARRGL